MHAAVDMVLRELNQGVPSELKLFHGRGPAVVAIRSLSTMAAPGARCALLIAL
jgi:hypothetical protein